MIAVNDGRVTKIGHNKRLGRYVQLQDVYGNTYTYAHLEEVATTYPAPKKRKAPRPRSAASSTFPRRRQAARAGQRHARRARTARAGGPRRPAKQRLEGDAGAHAATALPTAVPDKQRLFANPSRPNALRRRRRPASSTAAGYSPQFAAGVKFNPRDFEPKRLHKGARMIAGTVLGRIGRTSKKKAPHLRFEIRPAGRGAPRVDPKPILDGWKLLESTEIYRAKKRNPFFGADAETPSIGQIMLMSKEALARHVLANPRIDIYGCGRHDIQTGQIDRRVLATLEFLASSGLKPTVSSLRCGHGYLTDVGQRLRAHDRHRGRHRRDQRHRRSLGHQGKGSITDLTIQRLLTLQGTMKPHQIISLMTFEGADNTLALARPRRPHPRRLPPAVRRQRQGLQAGPGGAQAQAVDQADRPPRRDRQPRRARGPVEVRDAHQARLALARRRLDDRLRGPRWSPRDNRVVGEGAERRLGRAAGAIAAAARPPSGPQRTGVCRSAP